MATITKKGLTWIIGFAIVILALWYVAVASSNKIEAITASGGSVPYDESAAGIKGPNGVDDDLERGMANVDTGMSAFQADSANADSGLSDEAVSP